MLVLLISVNSGCSSLVSVTVASNNTYDQGLATIADRVALNLLASGGILQPTCRFWSGGGSVAAAVSYTSSRGAGAKKSTQWVCSYWVSAVDKNGNVSFTVDYTPSDDSSTANVSACTDGSAVVVDQTKPKITNVSIASSNSAKSTVKNLGVKRPNGWNENRNVATTDDIVTLTVTADEFIYVPVAVFKSGGDDISDTSITYLDENNLRSSEANKIWSCKFTSSATDTEGPVTFVVTFRDAAGNEGTAVTSVQDGTSVIVDKTKPKVTNVSIASTNAAQATVAAMHGTPCNRGEMYQGVACTNPFPISLYAGTSPRDFTPGSNLATVNDTVTITLVADEFIYQPACVFFTAGQKVQLISARVQYADIGSGTSMRWICRYTLLSIDISGPLTFTIDFKDIASNKGVQLSDTTDDPKSNILVDTTLPILTAVAMDSNNAQLNTIATLDDFIVLRFSSDEEIYIPECEFFSGPPRQAKPVSGAVSVKYVVNPQRVDWICSYTVNTGIGYEDQAGRVSFRIKFRDTAGNQGTDVTIAMGAPITTFNPCYGSYCMHINNNHTSISGREDLVNTGTGPPDSTDCYRFNEVTGDGVEQCNIFHPNLVVDSPTRGKCEYGPTYSDLGQKCKMCPHPLVVNSQRTECKACVAGFGPNYNHTACVPCLNGTKSEFAVCTPCPIGSTSNRDHTMCVDIDECETNDGGCDVLATVGVIDETVSKTCINEDFTAAGYKCGTCPFGFMTVPTAEDFFVVRQLSHGEEISLKVENRINGTRCNLPPPPPPPPAGAPAAAVTTVTVQPKVTLEMSDGCDESKFSGMRRLIAESLGVKETDIARLSCGAQPQPGASRRLQASNSSSSSSSTLSFVLQSPSAAQDMRTLSDQLKDPNSKLMSSNESSFVKGQTAIPEFQCPAGSTLAESGLECRRCTVGNYNPKPAGTCKPCPADQTSTSPFHTCHCLPGMFNTSYMMVRCFEPMEPYTMSYVLSDSPDEPAPLCSISTGDDAWRGDCCRKCPEPSDRSFNDQCVDCTAIGSAVDQYDRPVPGAHGVMIPRVLKGWKQSASGMIESAKAGCSGAGNGTCGPVEFNLFRCPFQTDDETGVQGSCLGQIRLNSSNNPVVSLPANSSTEEQYEYANESSCATGYAGALCGGCNAGFTMTTSEGCIECNAGLPACLPACLSFCLSACLPSCLASCLPACLFFF